MIVETTEAAKSVFTDLPSIKDLTSYGVLLLCVLLAVRALPKIIERYMASVAERESRAHELVRDQLATTSRMHDATIVAQDARHQRMLEQHARESSLDREACDRRAAEMTATICTRIAEMTTKPHA